MRFIFGGENWLNYLERLAYDGVIGIFYKDTWSGVLAHLIVLVILLLAVIGFFTVLKRILFGKKK